MAQGEAGGVPDPGPQPAAFTFPFAEAQLAAAAIEELMTATATVLRTHGDAMSSAFVDFEGPGRNRFEQAMISRTYALAGLSSMLHGQLSDLRADVAQAHNRQAQRDQDIHEWKLAYERYQADRAVPAGG